MLTVGSNSRFFLYQTPVNMRKSFEGLSGLVEQAFPRELFSGAFFIFLSRKRDHMKVLHWDIDGLVIWFKRLEKGAFSRRENKTTLTRKDFILMLEGVVPKHIEKRFSL